MIGRQLLMKPKRRSRHREASPDFKRTVHVAGRKTSVSLESAFWQALKTIAALEKKSVHDLVTKIDNDRQNANLSSAIRLFVLGHYFAQGNRRRRSPARPQRS
jgi:predicted DNA-binding ribbon-helix-helix protein